MKKLLCVILSLALISTSGIFMSYASKGDGKSKTVQDKNKNITQSQNDSTEGEDAVSEPKATRDKSKNASIDALKEQFKELHRDKEKRKELLKQIVELRRQNNDKSSPVFIDGVLIETDVPPVIKSGRTLIPLRAIANGLKANVEWDAKTNTVTISKDGTVIVVTPGSNIVTVNGQEVKIEVPAETISNRTMVPVRFISEIFKKSVDWDKDTGSVIIEDGSGTPAPSATPDAAAAPEATQTPAPEATAEITATPVPTDVSSQEPTATPAPIATPEPAL